jgi:predicted nucleic acid-binding protein
MTKLDDALGGVNRLGFDTSPVIYFVEANPKYDLLLVEIFQRIAKGTLRGVTSVITLTEVLVQPIIHNQTLLQQEYRDLLHRSRNFTTISITSSIAERASHLRARHRLRTPDAIQIAAALETGCEAILSNDRDLRRATELRILILDELEI